MDDIRKAILREQEMRKARLEAHFSKSFSANGTINEDDRDVDETATKSADEVHKEVKRQSVNKSFDDELHKVMIELGFEKAHQDGDIHPNGKYVWVSSAAGGKGDWRTLNGRIHKKHQASAGSAASTGSSSSSAQLQNQKTTNTPKPKTTKTTIGSSTKNLTSEGYKYTGRINRSRAINSTTSATTAGTKSTSAPQQKTTTKTTTSSPKPKTNDFDKIINSATKIKINYTRNGKKLTEEFKRPHIRSDKWTEDIVNSMGSSQTFIYNNEDLKKRYEQLLQYGATIETNRVVDTDSIDDSEYKKQYNTAKKMGQDACNMALELINTNISKKKRTLESVIKEHPGAKATIDNLQEDLTKFVSQKKAIEDFLKENKSTKTTSSKNLPKQMEDFSKNMNKYEEDNSPFTYTDNGVADLNRQGKKGFSVWVGFEHAVRGRQPVNRSKMSNFVSNVAVKQFVKEVNAKTGKKYTVHDVAIDDRWDSTDMFRMYIDTDKTK